VGAMSVSSETSLLKARVVRFRQQLLHVFAHRILRFQKAEFLGSEV
jgi:hypothetical protein